MNHLPPPLQKWISRLLAAAEAMTDEDLLSKIYDAGYRQYFKWIHQIGFWGLYADFLEAIYYCTFTPTVRENVFE